MQIKRGELRLEVTNRFLLALPADSMNRLEPHLEPFDLIPGASLYQVGAPVRHIYFINRGFISIVKTMGDGRTVAIGAKGGTDIIGLFGLHGIDHMPWEPVVQVPGAALRLGIQTLRAEADASPAVQRLVDRYTHWVLGSLAQTAACHRLHSLRQRFCRWLLEAQDSTSADTLPLTHETLALILGVQRSGVSIVASAFHRARVIRSGRGNLTILDRRTLEAEACECYSSTRCESGRLFTDGRGSQTGVG